jgi:hypothetical protein
MRYRSVTGLKDFSRDLATFVSFMGGAKYGRLLERLGQGLNHKGYVTPVDDLRFSLELELLNLELLRRQNAGGNLRGIPERLHEAAEFVMGLGEAIPHLSTVAKKKLHGQIVGGLKTNGLRSLQHEMRAAVALSRRDCDIQFADLEGRAPSISSPSERPSSMRSSANRSPFFRGIRSSRKTQINCPVSCTASSGGGATVPASQS